MCNHGVVYSYRVWSMKVQPVVISAQVPCTSRLHGQRSGIMPIVMLILTCLGSCSMLMLAHMATRQV